MTRAPRLVAAALVVVALAAAACGGSKSSAPAPTSTSTRSGISLPSAAAVPTTVVRPRPLPAGRVRHALAVAEAINAAGLGCRQAAIEPRLPLAGRSSTDPLEKVDCNVGDDSIAISLFESRAALVASLAVLRRGACFVARSQPTNLTYVTHDDWIVYPQHRATARALGERLGATVTTIRC